jgi:uncharacterized protein YwgA
MTNLQKAWVAAAAKTLADSGSWTGRTHLHKHLFIMNALHLAEVPFEFELYHYGPYSFELDSVVAEMEAFGDLDKSYRKAGYGPSYETTAFGDEAISELDSHDLSMAASVASKLSDFDSSDLELIATCLYVEAVEEEDDDDVIMQRVKEIKPKYSGGQIEWALSRARQLRAELRR